GQIVDGPEAANPESGFIGIEAIVARLVPVEQPIAAEPPLNEVVSRHHSWIGPTPISDTRHQQQGSIDLVAVELAGVAPQLSVEAAIFDDLLDRLLHAPVVIHG